MRKVTVSLALAVLPFIAYAQAQGTEAVQRSSSPQGMRIQGNNNPQASAGEANTNAAFVDHGNKSTSPATANVKSSTQIQGSTTIKTNAQNISAVASGKSNAAGNEVGAIGK